MRQIPPRKPWWFGYFPILLFLPVRKCNDGICCRVQNCSSLGRWAEWAILFRIDADFWFWFPCRWTPWQWPGTTRTRRSRIRRPGIHFFRRGDNVRWLHRLAGAWTNRKGRHMFCRRGRVAGRPLPVRSAGPRCIGIVRALFGLEWLSGSGRLFVGTGGVKIINLCSWKEWQTGGDHIGLKYSIVDPQWNVYLLLILLICPKKKQLFQLIQLTFEVNVATVDNQIIPTHKGDGFADAIPHQRPSFFCEARKFQAVA